ncbi:3-oxoacyl-[acyl-carrier-protein] reductase FabG-like [Uloborus diversus]|uniref:3-oxoacyl-[acyl-carrier-protein] reductase FabG-like n=1 Tax=Uloborus diversus TaxID=327109 RepID=UPI00240A1FDD|nr:3-oxoacyl-[acyl-carrier-protein] reductase FabG-like [Uloborus diversus]
MSDLTGKVALITGASSGIGAATAVHFASLGCKLALTGRNAENLEKTATDTANAGGKEAHILKIVGDVSNEDDRNKIIQATINFFGQLDILVNNAGILYPGTIENTNLESYDKIMDVNVRSILRLTQLAVPYLKETKGSIVNVSSIAGLRSFPNILAYCTSKSAVDQITRCTALELAADGVRVNSVNPGVIITEVHKRGGMSEENYAKFLEHAKETHALGRPGTADEVAKAIAFLADNNTSSFITGVNLPVDGGRGVMCPR